MAVGVVSGTGFLSLHFTLLFQGKVDLPVQGKNLKPLNIISVFQWNINI